jgi:hypothetical protein
MSRGTDNAPRAKRQTLTARNIESRSAARGFRDNAMALYYNLILLRFALLRGGIFFLRRVLDRDLALGVDGHERADIRV